MNRLRNNSLRRNCVALLSATLILSIAAMSGCRRNAPIAEGQTESPSSSNSDEPSSQTTTTIASSRTTQDRSPATANADLPDASTAPDEVCLTFMNLLKSGNRLTAEKLLTRRAETVLNRAGFPIQPLGSPAATYEMGEVYYATNKKKLANVACKVIDKVEGQTVETAVTWMIRKKTEGWRISGIVLQLDESQPNDLLSFENPDDVAHLKALMEQQADAVQETARLQ